MDGPILIQPKVDTLAPIERARSTDSAGFSDALASAINNVDQMQLDADQQSAQVAQGGGNLHETALALEKADVGMRVAMKARNKLVEAYHEVMRMSI